MATLTWYMYITTNLSYTRFKPFVKKKPLIVESQIRVFSLHFNAKKCMCVCKCVFRNRSKHPNILYSGSVFNAHKLRHCHKFKLYELI